jgi:hypothetical protein
MLEEEREKQTSSSNQEMNRHLADIFSKQDDPDYLERKRIEENREIRFDKSDLSL